MPDETMVTEAQAVRRERAAYVQGAIDRARSTAFSRAGAPDPGGDVFVRPLCGDGAVTATSAAAAAYKLPRVAVPRVVREPSGIEYTVLQDKACGEPGMLKIAMRWRPNEPWTTGFPPAMSVTLERAKLWADLLANPTTFVDADAVEAAG